MTVPSGKLKHMNYAVPTLRKKTCFRRLGKSYFFLKSLVIISGHVSVCLFSRPKVCLAILVMMMVMLMTIFALITVLCSVSPRHQPPRSKYAVYRHAAVATDAAPCSVVGRFVSNNIYICYKIV